MEIGVKLMKLFYSKSTLGFYVDEIHGTNIPADAVEISAEEHARLLSGQSVGKVIVVRDGGKPTLQDPPPPTPDQVRAAKVGVVQMHLDSAARGLNYDNIANAITYAEEPAVPKFQAEGRAFRAWRSLVWARFYEILAQVEGGARDMPSDAEFIGALPKFSFPAS